MTPTSTATPTRWPLIRQARTLAHLHADTGVSLGDLDADDSLLMDALGQFTPTTGENSFERWAARTAYLGVLARRLPLSPEARADMARFYRAERAGDFDIDLVEA